MDVPSKELLGSLSTLYSTGEYSDLEVECNGKQYRVHKSVLCPRSDFFAAACRGNFKEALEGKINLPDDDPEAVDLMIWYFYHLDYEVKSGAAANLPSRTALSLARNGPTSAELLVHVKVYLLAEKYFVKGLKVMAIQKFKLAATYHFNSAHFIEAAEHVYTSTTESDQDLRRAVVQLFFDHPELLDNDRVKACLRRVASLTFDVLMIMRRSRANVMVF